VTTEIVEEVVPESGRPPGFAGLLGRFTIEDGSVEPTITGLVGVPAPLEEAAGGWTASVKDPGNCDDAEGSVELTEEWSEITAVALTEDGAPVLTARWSLTEEPTAEGRDAGCEPGSNTGFLILVPAAALP
jgi:hypothetical protein